MAACPPPQGLGGDSMVTVRTPEGRDAHMRAATSVRRTQIGRNSAKSAMHTEDSFSYAVTEISDSTRRILLKSRV